MPNYADIPFSEIERVGSRGLLYQDLFCVSWLLGRFCNYSCSYCWPYAHSSTPDHRPKEQLLETLEDIKRQARARGFNSFHFSFSGGEPTLHKGLNDLLERLSDDSENCNFQSVHMTTNLSPKLKWMNRFVEASQSINRVTVTASYHHEMAEIEEFAEKARYLATQDIRLTVNIVMVPEHFYKLLKCAEYLVENQVHVTLKPQSNENASAIVSDYSEEMMGILKSFSAPRIAPSQQSQFKRPPSKYESGDITNADPNAGTNPSMYLEMLDSQGSHWFMDQAERLNSFDFNSFSDWDCSAGYRSLIIREPGGVVKRGYSCSDRPLGTLDSGFSLLPTVYPCKTKKCISSADSKIPKRKPGSSLPLFSNSPELEA